jgi:anti-anti-sigma factor
MREVVMPIRACGWHMTVAAEGHVLFVGFGFDRDPWHEPTGEAVAEKLFELAGRLGGRTLLLSLAEVPLLTSGLLGKLVALHKRTRATGGRLALCDLSAGVHDQLARTHLDRLFDVRSSDPAHVLALSS